jgi:esterase/lipase superfamily enzyme
LDRLLVAACISLALALGACAGRPSQGVLVPVAQSAEGTSRVNVFVAITRQRSTADAGEMFNGERTVGKSRPRFLLFASQDDSALTFSKSIWGGVERIGAIDPAQEPYQSELAHEHVEVFDLTKLKGSAHDRAFEDITEVMVMVKDRIGE